MTDLILPRCKSGDTCVVVSNCRGSPCFSKTVGNVIVVRACNVEAGEYVWSYDSPLKQCAWNRGCTLDTFADRDLQPLPKVSDTDEVAQQQTAPANTEPVKELQQG